MNTFSKSVVAVAAFAIVGSASAQAMQFTGTSVLKYGSKGAEVKTLQMVLNQCADTKVAMAGAGSMGMETMTYGRATEMAVKKFQAKAGVIQTGKVGSLTRAKLNMGNTCAGGVVVTPPTPGQTGPVMVSLATTTPAATSIIAGQALAKLADVTFTGNGTVNSVTLQRSGISDQNTLSNVYLYDGVNRLTDGYSFNVSGQITINNLNLMVSGSKTVSVVADVYTSTPVSQTVSVGLTSYMLAGATTPVSVANVMGNTMTIASGSTLAGIAYSGAQQVSTATNVNAGTSSYAVWRQGVNVTTRSLQIKAANFRVTGSAPVDAMSNVKFYVDGVNTGTTATMRNVNGSNYIAFDLSTAPKNLSTGSHTLEVRGDIVKGSSYNFAVGLQQASDLMVVDPSVGMYGTNVVVNSFNSASAATITISGGTSTLAIDPTFNKLTNITGGASNAVIGRFKLRGYGEDVKVYSLAATPVLTNACTTGAVYSAADVTGLLPATGNCGTANPNRLGYATGNGLQNVTLYFNGAQVGSQTPTWTSGAITFNLGSQMVIPAGVDSFLEVKADVRTSAGQNYTVGNISSNVAITQANVEGVSSKTNQNFPALGLSQVGNTLTIQTAMLGVSKDTGYANQTLSPNTANVKIGSFTLQNQSSSESVRVTNLAVALSGTSALTNLSALKVVADGITVNPVQPQTTNAFSVDFTLAPGATKNVAVFADTSSATGVTVITGLTVSSIGVSSNVSGTSTPVAGQTVTLNAGTLGTPTFVASSSTKDTYVSSPMGVANGSLANFKFISTNGPSTISELKFTVTGTDTVTAVKVGSQTAPVVVGVAWLQNLAVEVANGGSGTNQDVVVSYSPVGTNGIASGLTSKVALTYVKYTSGGTTAVLTPSVDANTVTLTGSLPVVTRTSSGVNVGAGSATGVKVGTISVKAVDGTVVLGNLPVNVAVPTGGTATNFVVKVAGSVPSGIVVAQTTTGSGPTAVTAGTFSFTNGYEISKDQTVAFDIYADISGVTTAGTADVSLGSAALFKWSDFIDGTTTNGTMTKTATLLGDNYKN